MFEICETCKNGLEPMNLLVPIQTQSGLSYKELVLQEPVMEHINHNFLIVWPDYYKANTKLGKLEYSKWRKFT